MMPALGNCVQFLGSYIFFSSSLFHLIFYPIFLQSRFNDGVWPLCHALGFQTFISRDIVQCELGNLNVRVQCSYRALAQYTHPNTHTLHTIYIYTLYVVKSKREGVRKKDYEIVYTHRILQCKMYNDNSGKQIKTDFSLPCYLPMWLFSRSVIFVFCLSYTIFHFI